MVAAIMPRTARFYAAVSVLTLGPDKDLAAAVRRMTPAVGELLEVIAAKPRVYERARKRAEDALGEIRDTADKRRR